MQIIGSFWWCIVLSETSPPSTPKLSWSISNANCETPCIWADEMRFSGNLYFCHWVIMSRSQKWPDLRPTQAESHFCIIAYERTSIRLESSSGKMLSFSIGNVNVTLQKIGQEVTWSKFKKLKIWHSQNVPWLIARWRTYSCLDMKSQVSELWAAKHRVAAWPQGIAQGYISEIVVRKKILATAGFPALNSPLDQF